MQYSDRHKLFPGMVIISYPGRWGGHFADRRHWLAELDGEVLDYHAKEHLIRYAVSKGLGYVVLRVHRNGDVTVQRRGGE